MKVIIHERKVKPDDELLLEWEWSDVYDFASTAGHFALDIGGLAPGAGMFIDGANAAWYAAEGDWLMAGMSIAAALPVFGWGAAAIKLTGKGVAVPFKIVRQFAKDAKIFNKAVDKFAKTAGLGKDVAKKIKDAVAAKMSGKAIKPAGKLVPSSVGKEAASVAKKEIKEIKKLFDGVVEKIPLPDSLKKEYIKRVLELKKLNLKLDGLKGTKNSAAISKLTKKIKDKEKVLVGSMKKNQLKAADIKKILNYSKAGIKAGAKTAGDASIKTAAKTAAKSAKDAAKAGAKTAAKAAEDAAIKIKDGLIKYKGKLPTIDAAIKKRIFTFVRKTAVKSISFQIDYQRLKDELDKTGITKLLEELEIIGGLEEIYNDIKEWACSNYSGFFFCDDSQKDVPPSVDDDPEKKDPTPGPKKSPRCDNNYLEKGCRGNRVKTLQRVLIHLEGPLTVGRRRADGIFGVQTKNGVENFQRKHDLKVDGIAGPRTFKKIIELIETKRNNDGKTTKIKNPEAEFEKGVAGLSDKEVASAVGSDGDIEQETSKGSKSPYWMSNEWTRLKRFDQKGPQGQRLKKKLIAQGWASTVNENVSNDLNMAIKSIKSASEKLRKKDQSAQSSVDEKISSLKLGSRDPKVKEFQKLLGITPSGVFDSKTKAAVEKFQQKHGLEVDGEVGSLTFDKIQKASDLRSSIQENKVHKNFHYNIIQEKMLRLNRELMKEYKKG